MKIKKSTNKLLAENTSDEKNPKLKTKEWGRSGTSITSGKYDEEYISNLIGSAAAIEYNKMRRSDPQVKKLISATVNPIKKAVWDIEPASDETIDIEAAALMEQIFFKDIDWVEKLHEILTFPIHGHSVFEPIHENKEHKDFGPYTGLKAIAFRDQTTLEEWNYDKTTGKLKNIYQKQSGDIEIDVYIPAEDLLIFYNEKEGDSNGVALLRSLYGPYVRKKMEEELKIIGIERFSIPTPMLEVPTGTDPTSQEFLDAKAILQNFTNAQSAFIMYPEGWKLELHNNVFDPEKVEKTIKAEDEKMAGAFLATFLELGIGGNSGAYALGNDLSDFFFAIIEYLGDVICSKINRELIPNLCRLNYGDALGKFPSLKYSGISDKAGKELMEVLTGYKNADMIQMDEKLADYIRKVNKLPKKEEGTILDNQEGQENKDENDNDSTDDNNDDNNMDNINEENKVLKFSLKNPANAYELVKAYEIKVNELMKDKLNFIGDKYIADIMNNYKQLPDKNKIKATKGVKVGGQAKFKREFKGLLTTIATEALNMAKKEIPEMKDFQFKDKTDFSKLPLHVRELLNMNTDKIVSKYTGEVEDVVSFQFINTNAKTNDANVMEFELKKSKDKKINSGTMKTAAANITSTIVNQTRATFFYEPEVLNLIESFTFMNPSPVSAICIKMTGLTFEANDPIVQTYTTPLHHGCKSHWRANLKKSKNKPSIDKHPTITQAERDSINLNEKS